MGALGEVSEPEMYRIHISWKTIYHSSVHPLDQLSCCDSICVEGFQYVLVDSLVTHVETFKQAH